MKYITWLLAQRAAVSAAPPGPGGSRLWYPHLVSRPSELQSTFWIVGPCLGCTRMDIEFYMGMIFWSPFLASIPDILTVAHLGL